MDYYQILGVSKNASPEEIKKAYRSLSKEWHPDKHKGDKAAEEKYKQINRAYEALSDPKKKQAYDQFGNEDGPQFGGGGFGQGPFGSAQGASFGGGFSDIFETFFGGSRGGRPRDERGRDAEVAIEIALEESFHGITKTIRLRKFVACETCKGSGDTEGSSKVTCKTCGGTGQVVRTVQSFFGTLQQSTLCDTCAGAGKVSEKPCKTCAGEGRVQGSEEISVEVPAGIDTGQRLRIRGKGEAGRHGAPAGDLYVEIAVKRDSRFERRGDDLLLEIAVPVTDAVLGGEVTMKTFEDPVTLKIPAGTQPNQILRVKGKGMPVLNTSRRGDLYVTVNVEVPARLSRSERKLWEELKKF